VGEWATSSIWHGQGAELTALSDIHFPHSLGLLYSAFTYYCGFRVNAGEYKLMGLAPYGEPRYVDLIFQHLIDVKPDGSFRLNMRYFDYAVGSVMTNKRFADLFGGPALPADETPEQRHFDLARSIQVVTEEIVVKIAKYAKQLTGSNNLCLAGGVALNCVANAQVLAQAGFDNLWIQPASGDAGGALGAALQAWYSYFENTREHCVDQMQGAYLGPKFDDKDVLHAIETKQVVARRIDEDELLAEVADWLTKDNVVGWFQDRMEFGPRALGNRTILGDARSASMQRKMNIAIKQRESFRPFAPIVKLDKVSEYFEFTGPSPYMLLTADINPALKCDTNDDAKGLERVNQIRSSLPAITHIDYSARLQTIAQKTNPKLYALLDTFEKLTQVPVLINTSFNVRGEPPVCSPEDAIRCFLATDMDYLVMGQWVLDKREQSDSAIALAKSVTFEKD
ncbi:MAG: carbamoyltransferase, partial [Alteromonas sp.]